MNLLMKTSNKEKVDLLLYLSLVIFYFCGKMQMDPKFLRNQRYARKHNPKTVESAEK